MDCAASLCKTFVDDVCSDGYVVALALDVLQESPHGSPIGPCTYSWGNVMEGLLHIAAPLDEERYIFLARGITTWT